MLICEKCLSGAMKHDAYCKPKWVVCPVCSHHLLLEVAEEVDSPLYSADLGSPPPCHGPLPE